MSWAPAFLSNPDRFMAFSRWAAPMFGLIALGLAVVGLYLGFTAPEDYQQGQTVRIMFIHVPAAQMSMFAYACLGVASFLSLIFRHTLADCAAQAAAPLGAAFTFLALVTGSLWGRPMWGTWWEWDGRLTSVLVMFLLYIAYMALRASMDDEVKAARAAAILALVGSINLPIIHFSVEWWNSIHQGSSIFRKDGPSMPAVFWVPLLLMALAYMSAFGSLWLVRIRGEVWRRKAEIAAQRAARD
ncbi:MAG: heme ABC transporter permease CcmC [Alphaproteobacteria bacterium]|nr:heme ABC transporter permease CcmC [Alphaproteobacteria bacterium]MBU1514865.1 heme ABC transporter permease CcmC [Alphaproteobacteria bacterium]MBU2093786.1 heme ABC transporter permease CcmC [Alphaproteobacteria bacterium]MBU2149407.1 heme ABC transporter permease CcmC [Alphaproteobacteria bacterium]MBU2305367.1 heme ABC transporter permease CcmC [Alphaproteobacteria bacterium]